MIQYSPYIEGTIPAFKIGTIKVPFEMNPAVGKQEVKGFSLIVKETGSPNIVAEVTQTNMDMVESALENKVVTFNIISDKIKVNQYYKIQIAYMSNSSETSGDLVYSTAAIGRCISVPKLYIKELTDSVTNAYTNYFTGIYETTTISEPVYSYRFYIKQQNTGEILEDSGELLYNTFYDVIENERICKMEYISNLAFEEGIAYYIEYEITTVNGYTDSVRYRLFQEKRNTPVDSGLRLIVNNVRDEGYILINLIGNREPATLYTGNYVLYRKTLTEKKKLLDKILEFSITSSSRDRDWNNFQWRDMTVESGVEYEYLLYKYKMNSSNILVNEEYATPAKIKAQFEDLILNDGKQQLAIRFNPKVSSFKETVQEAKVETIGSKYPFFFRNGNLSYKEIPISGLISYLQDENELFIKKEILFPNQENYTNSTNLTDDNIYAERKFRAAALEWLNNGQPKVFRSPTEGNYIIRLMNVSLQPNDTLGRMVYSFSATGYEIADYNYKNLQDMNLVNCVIEGKKTGKWGNN